MVQIVNKEHHASVVKEKVCYKCGATLSYVPLDVLEDYSTDYLGDKDYYKYIECVNCEQKVRLKYE